MKKEDILGLKASHVSAMLSVAVALGILGGCVVQCAYGGLDVNCEVVIDTLFAQEVNCEFQLEKTGDQYDQEDFYDFFQPFYGCIDMSPDEMRVWKQEVTEDLNSVISDANGLKDVITAISNFLDDYRRDYIVCTDGGEVSPFTGNASSNEAITSFWNNVQAVAPSKLLQKVNSVFDSMQTGGSSGLARKRYQVMIYSGFVEAAKDVENQIRSKVDFEQANAMAEGVATAFEGVKARVQELPEEPMDGVYSWVGGDDIGGGGGPDAYNWCTVEQGAAIIELIRKTQDEVKTIKTDLQLFSDAMTTTVSNLVAGSFFYTDYGGFVNDGFYVRINNDGTNVNWKQFYRLGSLTESVPGYNPSNIMHRIELLLFGLSGAGDDETEIPSKYHDQDFDEFATDASSSVTNMIETFVAQADQHRTRAESLKDSFLTFIQSFSSLRGKNALESSDVFTPQFQFTVGGQSVDVPSITLGDNNETIPVVQRIGNLFHGFCSFIFYIGGAFILWRYWSWFSVWVFRFCKWASEIIGGLFVK